MNQTKIGKFIAELRKEQNMTQLNLAEKLGITDRAVSKWENGRGMPDLSLIEPLCETLNISVSEFLKGERIEECESTHTANETILCMMSDHKQEIKKQRKIYALILTVILFINIFIVTSMLIADLRGEGYTLYAISGTYKAEYVARKIIGGDYEKAAKHIGFFGRSREEAEKQWCNSMESLSEEVRIERLEISPIIEDDFFLSGDCLMIVFDLKTQISHVFELQITIQDGGVAFGNIYIPGTNTDTRRAEIASLIDNALSTWYAG